MDKGPAGVVFFAIVLIHRPLDADRGVIHRLAIQGARGKQLDSHRDAAQRCVKRTRGKRVARVAGGVLLNGAASGVVVIGRNEAARLPACLRSLPVGAPLFYVDSGSSDGSPDVARCFGVAVLHLSDDLPFGAARARNAGFKALLAAHPDLESVFFIDGDCVLDPNFLFEACSVLHRRADCAIVVGRVEEENAGANVFGLLAKLEWSSSGPGEIDDFGQLGGIMLVRAADFSAIGGFDPAFIAGEDSELGIRLHLAGRRTLRIDRTMAHHAMDMERFGQWWRRSVRAGHALAHRNAVHGGSALADSRAAVKSTLVYGIAIPCLAVAGLATLGLAGAMPLAAYAFLGWRFLKYYQGKGATRGAAMTGAAFGILGKFANAVGLIRFHVQRARGRFRLLEYK